MPLFLLSANKVVRTMQGRHCASSSSGIFLTKFTNIPYVYCLCGIATLLVQYSGTGSFSVQNSGFCTVKQALLPPQNSGFCIMLAYRLLHNEILCPYHLPIYGFSKVGEFHSVCLSISSLMLMVFSSFR